MNEIIFCENCENPEIWKDMVPHYKNVIIPQVGQEKAQFAYEALKWNVLDQKAFCQAFEEMNAASE